MQKVVNWYFDFELHKKSHSLDQNLHCLLIGYNWIHCFWFQYFKYLLIRFTFNMKDALCWLQFFIGSVTFVPWDWSFQYLSYRVNNGCWFHLSDNNVLTESIYFAIIYHIICPVWRFLGVPNVTIIIII